MSKIPTKIGGANLKSYLVITSQHQRTGNTQHWVGGKLLDEIYGLAICKYEGESGYYLFYCNNDWESITDTWHETIEDAKEQGEFEYANTINCWIDQS